MCTGTPDPATLTFTLTADCGEVTSPLTVPNGWTVEGGGHVITATDPVGVSFHGGVVTNAAGATLMHVNNVTIRAVGFVFHGAQNCESAPGSGVQLIQVGLLFEDASGTATDVIVQDITQHSGCQTGNGIRANARSGTARTVTLTHVTVTGFQKNGVTGSGQVTLNVGGASTIGPPDQHLPGGIGTNSVQYGVGGAGGTFAGNTVIGSGFAGTGTASVAILVFDAANLTIDNNTITGAGTDIGISVTSSNNITISNNAVGRTAPDSPDNSGTGIRVDAAAASLASPVDPPPVPSTQVSTNVRLICNTFSGWQPNKNIVGAVQMSCTPLPAGTECVAYSASVFSVEGGTAPFTWSVTAGALPPGLVMDPATGAITGTPTAAGTFNFTVQVADATQPSLTATQPQTITIAPGCDADLALTKVVSNASVNVGDQVTFTLTLTNNGPNPATNVEVTDLLPAGLTLVSATPSQGTYDPATGRWIVGSVTTATATLQLVVTIASTGAITNTASISASDQPDPTTGNNTASASVSPPTTDAAPIAPTTTTGAAPIAPTTTTGAAPIAPTTTFNAGSAVLPPTGGFDARTSTIAALALAMGIGLVLLARRRRPTAPHD